MKLCHLVVLPPPYQRPPGAEIPAMGFAATLKILVKANLLSSLETAQVGTPSASVQSASRRCVYVHIRTLPYQKSFTDPPASGESPGAVGICMTPDPFSLRVRTRCVSAR